MSGRRLRATVAKTLALHDPYFEDATVVIAGLSNAYHGYITTHEEYCTPLVVCGCVFVWVMTALCSGAAL
jgi:hypothetical protein